MVFTITRKMVSELQYCREMYILDTIEISCGLIRGGI